MNQIIKDSLDKSMSYQAYRDLMAKMVENESSTGDDKSQDMVEYTKLNEQRMKRWDKTLKVSDSTKEDLADIDTKQTWLVLAESWCGDAAHVIPVFNKLAELNENITFRVVLRDDNDALMNQFLTNGGKSIPKLIIIDDTTKKVINSFGPRPAEATKLVVDYKAKHGMITPEIKEELQQWYNKDKGQSVMSDLMNLLTVSV
ncbi:thioredoxin family protein [Xanthomarina sp. F2636L]|uniref:thioredoxin family protein n=1 Tax=Xanthomarina sp. F2636L TaxID=2996018 RepID=UPI00225E0DF2|nr:thioredoxin family protein [Xanthomarina sp. F2636L]MCX7551021.1 thioredoxin family protein [Xanthomarina sp. F2636L]